MSLRPLLALSLVLPCAPAPAGPGTPRPDAPVADRAADEGARTGGLREAYLARLEAWQERHALATDPETRAGLVQTYPDPRPVAAELLDRTRGVEPGEETLAAWGFVVEHAWGPTVPRALELLVRHHGDAPELAPLLIAADLDDACLPLLERLAERTEDDAVEATALFVLGSAWCDSRDGAVRERGEACLQRVVDEHSGVALLDGQLRVAEEAEHRLFDLRHLRPGCWAPAIEGRDLHGLRMRLEDFRGQVVLLEFWGEWCELDEVALAERRRLEQDLQGRPFVHLGVHAGPDAEAARAYLEAHGLRWRSFQDEGPDGRIARAWHTRTWPTSFVIDPSGRIRHRDLSGHRLRALVTALVEARERSEDR